MGEQGMNTAEQIGVGLFQFLSSEERLTIEGLGFAEVTFFLPEIGEDADLLDELPKAGGIPIRKSADLLDTAGGRQQLALKVGIHGKK
jgi:hypothetical protein